jgi:hypothetical protein
LSKFADYISSSVKSDTALPPDTTSTNLLANKILDVSTEKPTEVSPNSKMAAIISGKVYRFPPRFDADRPGLEFKPDSADADPA